MSDMLTAFVENPYDGEGYNHEDSCLLDGKYQYSAQIDNETNLPEGTNVIFEPALALESDIPQISLPAYQ